MRKSHVIHTMIVIRSQSIVVDSLENAFISGQTQSTDFPTNVYAYDMTIGGTMDAFVTKMSTIGSSLVYSTYLGGMGIDYAVVRTSICCVSLTYIYVHRKLL